MTVALRPLDEDLLTRLLEAAVQGADPDEVMPPLAGPPGWTDERRTAFVEFHRTRSVAAEEPVETTYAVLVERGGREEVVGAGRLEPVPNGVEVGIWISRQVRGGGVGRAAVSALVDLAWSSGTGAVIAETTTGNTAAVGILRGLGGELRVDGGDVHGTLRPTR